MGLDTVIHAQLTAEGCTAELYVNGIPVSRIHPDRTAFESVAAEEYLIPGRNRIEILVEPGSHPSVARTEARNLDLGDATVIGRLVRFKEGEFVEASRGDILAEVRFQREPDERDPRIVPRSVSTEVDLGAANGRWAFQDAPVLDLDEATIAEAIGVLDAVADAVRARSVQGVMALGELKNRDALRAYPALGEEMIRADLQESFDSYAKLSDFVAPRRPEQHDFRLVAGGRILETIDRDWTASLKLSSPATGEEVPFPLMLARIDGRLRIVR
jgi:hypothetical protein